MNPSGNTTLSRQVLQMVTNTASFYEQKYSNWHQQQTEENKNETFNFSCWFFVLLCFSMSPFDLICSFGLVMAKQLIQQTCLMRCEACTQIQLSYPLPTFLLCSAYWRYTSLTGTVSGSDGGIPIQTWNQSGKPEISHSQSHSLFSPQSWRWTAVK